MRNTLFCFFILLLISGCSKTDEVIVPDNTAPPDHTISTVTYTNYINRTYILILGRKPTQAELSSDLNLLKSNNLDSTSRYKYLDNLFLKTEYRNHVYEKQNAEILNNLDSSEVTHFISVFNFYLQDTTFQFLWPAIQGELTRLDLMRNAPQQYVNKQIDIRELQKRLVNNYFYDQINMGAANFVITTFQHFLNRNPVISEQNAGVGMIGGTNSVLFLQSGSSKDDYLQIFFNAKDYYEGAVVLLYNEYLYHDPTSVQMSNASQKFKQSGDYEKVQKDILATDEFIGIN